MEIQCAQCGRTFKRRRTTQVYCGFECRRLALVGRREPRSRPCSRCGKTIASSGFHLAYCDECRTATCPVCGKTYPRRTRSKYCSYSCSGKAPGRWVPTGSDHWNWRGGGDSYHTHAWHRVRDQVRERDGWRCVDCGRHKDEIGRMHAHHLVSRSDWGDRAGSPDTPDNLVTLCTGCHKKRHSLPESAAQERKRQTAREHYRRNRDKKLAYDRARRERKRAEIT